MRSRRIIVAIVGLAVGGVVFGWGPRWFHHRQVEGEVLAALRNPDRMERLRAFSRLKNSRGREPVRIAAGYLNDPDPALRRAAAVAISGMNRQPDIEPVFVENLRSNSDPGVRFSCAVSLMSIRSPDIDGAFLNALHDSNDKIVQIACTEVGFRKLPGARQALAAVLKHPSWRVRLEACKGMILAGVADPATIETLKSMSQEPEAARYDAEIEEFDRREKELGIKKELGGSWGKIGAILEQARKVASASQ